MDDVDLHAHVLTPAFRRAMDRLGIDPLENDGFALPDWSADAHLEFMDSAGIARAVLTVPPPHLHNGDDRLALAATRDVNDETAEVCREHPERFGFAACVPLPYVDGALEEAVRAMDELGACGVRVSTNNHGVYLGDHAFDPFFEEMDRRGAMVIMHPCRPMASPRDCVTGGVAAIYEYPADTTRAVLNMIATRTMTRFPHVRFVVPHCGAFLPYMLQRFAGVSRILARYGAMDPVDVHEEARGLWYDVAGDPEPVALAMLRMVAPADRIVYGSDYPHSPAAVVLPKKRALEADPRFSDIDLRANGMRLLDGRA